MKAFVWQSVRGITSSWHDGGGVLAVAEDVDAARSAVRDYCSDAEAHVEGTFCHGLDEDPTVTMSTDSEPLVLIFPDAGCC